MKKSMLKYIITFSSILIVGITIPVILSNSSIQQQDTNIPSSLYSIVPPTIPEELSFNNEMIDLRRYDRRERIDRELMAFMFMHSSTTQLIKKANRYFPIVEPILIENGIPDDFKYLMEIGRAHV